MTCALGACLVRPARAQIFSDRTTKIIIGFAAGGPGDVLARLYAQKLHDVLGGSFIVENRPGGSQIVAIRALMTSPPDGSTIMLGTGSGLVQGPGVYRDLPYNPLTDFTPIAEVASTPGVFFVNSELPVHTMEEFIAFAKDHPGKLNYGSSGVGTAGYFQMEFLKKALGLDIVHVPLKADSQVAFDVTRGELQVALTTVQPVLPLLAANGIRPLAVTAKTRLDAMPNVPTFEETGITQLRGLDNFTFYGMVGPAGMSKDRVDRLNDAINKIGAMPDVIRQMRETLIFQVMSGPPADLETYMKTEIQKWHEVGQALGSPSFGN